MQEKLTKLCGMYENTSKTSGRRYFVGSFTFETKLLLFENKDAKEGEPQWTLFITEKQPKPQQSDDGIPDPGEPLRRRKAA